MKPLGPKKKCVRFSAVLLFVLVAVFPSVGFAEENAFVEIEKRKLAESADRASMVIQATGIGYESRRHSGAQARLMARRAAVVDGYRKIAAMRGKVVGSLTGKTYYESADDFIKGASVIETRYYYDGRVEVDMEAPVSVSRRGGHRVSYTHVRDILEENDVVVLEVEPERHEITREEWEELFRKRGIRKQEEGFSERVQQMTD